MLFLGYAALVAFMFISKGTEPVGNVTTNPSRCISEVASSGPSGCENSNTTQGTEPDNIVNLYKMLFFIAVATVAVLLLVFALLFYKLVMIKKECLSLVSQLQRVGKLSAEGHASDAEKEPHYCPLRWKGNNSEVCSSLSHQ